MKSVFIIVRLQIVLLFQCAVFLPVNPRFNLVRAGGEAEAGFPVKVGIAFLQGRVSFRHGAFVGCAERIQDFAFELFTIVVKKRADYRRFLMPPNREADEYGIDIGKINIHGFYGGAKRLIEMFLSAA